MDDTYISVTLERGQALLTLKAISGLGGLSGNEIDVLHRIQVRFRNYAGEVEWDDSLLTDYVALGMDASLEISLPKMDWELLYNGVLGMVKCFSAPHIPHIAHLRKSIMKEVYPERLEAALREAKAMQPVAESDK